MDIIYQEYEKSQKEIANQHETILFLNKTLAEMEQSLKDAHLKMFELQKEKDSYFKGIKKIAKQNLSLDFRLRTVESQRDELQGMRNHEAISIQRKFEQFCKESAGYTEMYEQMKTEKDGL